MPFELAAEAIDQGCRLEGYATVGSTNAVAMERARAGHGGPLWVAALGQTDGRGRRGRTWETPSGNLAATLLLTVPDPTKAATLGFVAGLALSDALEEAAPRLRLRVGLDGGATDRGGRFALKWPNDVLGDGAKLAGILLESFLRPDGQAAVAAGMGVNVVAHPEGLAYPATSLRAMGVPATAETVFTALSRAFARRAAEWNRGEGLGVTREAWLRRAAGLGKEIAIRTDGRVIRGVFEAIDENCRLIVRDGQGRRSVVTAGDVHFGAAASLGAA